MSYIVICSSTLPVLDGHLTVFFHFRVLKPPGGGSSISFGYEDDAESKPKTSTSTPPAATANASVTPAASPSEAPKSSAEATSASEASSPSPSEATVPSSNDASEVASPTSPTQTSNGTANGDTKVELNCNGASSNDCSSISSGGNEHGIDLSSKSNGEVVAKSSEVVQSFENGSVASKETDVVADKVERSDSRIEDRSNGTSNGSDVKESSVEHSNGSVNTNGSSVSNGADANHNGLNSSHSHSDSSSNGRHHGTPEPSVPVDVCTSNGTAQSTAEPAVDIDIKTDTVSTPDKRSAFSGATAGNKPHVVRATPPNHHMRSSIFTGNDDDASYSVSSSKSGETSCDHPCRATLLLLLSSILMHCHTKLTNFTSF